MGLVLKGGVPLLLLVAVLVWNWQIYCKTNGDYTKTTDSWQESFIG